MMDVVRGVNSLTQRLIHPVVAIGNFDGVHLGHQKIIQIANQKATARAGQSVTYTFRPHPQMALLPQKNLQLLSTYDEKLELLSKLNINLTIEEPFSREFSTIEPEQFFTENLLKKIGAECIIVGYDFGFGKNRNGHLNVLEGFCKQAKVELIIVQPLSTEGELVSSSKIRHYLLSGQIQDANRLLGRSFSYKGIIAHGEGRGKKIGFPTANLKLENKLALPYGVYATWATIGKSQYASVTNVGIRPTFQLDANPDLPALVETHLIDHSIDLYGHTLEVHFISRLREERKFNGVEELRKQISLDVAKAKLELNNYEFLRLNANN